MSNQPPPPGLRTCQRCKKPYLYTGANNPTRSYCRPCYAEYMREYRKTPKAQAYMYAYNRLPHVVEAGSKRRRSPEYVRDTTNRIRAIAEASGCVDCGGKERLVFHHVDPTTKRYEIGMMGHRAWKAIEQEMSRCVVLCHKCHMARHKAMRAALKASGGVESAA